MIDYLDQANPPSTHARCRLVSGLTVRYPRSKAQITPRESNYFMQYLSCSLALVISKGSVSATMHLREWGGVKSGEQANHIAPFFLYTVLYTVQRSLSKPFLLLLLHSQVAPPFLPLLKTGA